MHRLPLIPLFLVLFCFSVPKVVAQIGPWNSPLKIASSGDGRTFSVPTTFQDSSGVPSAVGWKGDTLLCAFQWFRQPTGSSTWDRVAVKFSYDGGLNWTNPSPIVIDAFPANFQRPFDPTLVVTAGDSIRLYFSSSNGIQPGLDSAVNTYSAIGIDGIHYRFEPGPRVDHPTRRVIDPAVVWFNGMWHYCSPIGAPQEGAYHYTSADGLMFSPNANFPSDNTHNWTGNYLIQNGSELRFYGSGPQLWYNTSPDGFTWNGYVNTNVQGGDPTVVKVSSANYLIVFVGQPYQTSVRSHDQPGAFVLFQNYPNPFNPVTNIQFSIANSQLAILRVYDVLGQEVATLVNEVMQPGTYMMQFDASNLMSGVYSCRLNTGEYMLQRKMLLLR